MADRITLSQGAGGTEMDQLLRDLLLSRRSLRTRVGHGVGLAAMDDGAVIPVAGRNVVFTTDAYTVTPRFFAGGDIGCLSVYGTCNDLAVMGAAPLALVSALVIEEGFDRSELERIMDSAAAALARAGAALVGGDTKVVPRGAVDGLMITTSGVGVAEKVITHGGARPGDCLIVTGPVGDHGLAILSQREGISFDASVESDCGPVWPPLRAALAEGGVHAAKDPTRGGLAMAACTMAERSGVGIRLREADIPVREAVAAGCAMLGLDPLALACEGRALLAVDGSKASRVLAAIRRTREGRGAAIVGEAVSEWKGRVILETTVGGERFVDPPAGDTIPRIC